MIKCSRLLDISNELRVFCFGNGIKLIRPEKVATIKTLPYFHDTGHTVSSIMALPLNVALLNTDSNTQTINELSAATSGWLSVKDAIGKSIQDIAHVKSAKIIMMHNRDVMSCSKKIIFEESIIRKNNTSTEVIAIKSPWYDDNNQIIGLFGCGFRLDSPSIAQSLALIAQIGILHHREMPSNNKKILPGHYIANIYFTKRQVEILSHLIRGKSAKDIGALLTLSPRTIETYLAHCKLKLGVNSKAELIDKVLDHFYSKIQQY
jgi:DNA-binding NarL/FixJ family response regulator